MKAWKIAMDFGMLALYMYGVHAGIYSAQLLPVVLWWLLYGMIAATGFILLSQPVDKWVNAPGMEKLRDFSTGRAVYVTVWAGVLAAALFWSGRPALATVSLIATALFLEMRRVAGGAK